MNSVVKKNINWLGIMTQRHCKGHMATFPASTGGGKPQVPLCAVFQAWAEIE